ncbi:DUF397 domain-containing protein [Actinokineospora sp. NBRC 105648]|uniref:DUF397 domain-containing protein n=1 Tax=Actinokineospora sp. NBRC 105648 TaxID=3032206 RepID=UPI0024A1F6AB|nr:DUF397 domain-containing protein [Actinokineospora sp. NBRC 105648]GLZ38430.1 DUF397 domain-containing protein [Actinokineospora sp. NBRC 105648]
MTNFDLSQAVWRKSSKSSGNGECVEVALLAGAAAVRDSKIPDGEPVLLSRPGFAALVAHVATGPRGQS